MSSDAPKSSSTLLKEDQVRAACAHWLRPQGQQLILLSGDLGAGKTTLVKTFADLWGNESESSSPTYSLINEYELQGLKVYHVDLYRIESAEDLESTGFWDLFLETEAVIFVEWPERVPQDLWPQHWRTHQLKITISEDSLSRNYEWTFSS